jgi:oxysterol-binding protein-related protein 9/10/11
MAGTPTPKDNIPLDTEEGAAISVPDTGDAGEGGKLKMIIQLVKKCLGVKDIASMSVSCFLLLPRAILDADVVEPLTLYRRLSLPASLLEPIPNLEYWHYLDRPDLFAA